MSASMPATLRPAKRNRQTFQRFRNFQQEQPLIQRIRLSLHRVGDFVGARRPGLSIVRAKFIGAVL